MVRSIGTAVVALMVGGCGSMTPTSPTASAPSGDAATAVMPPGVPPDIEPPRSRPDVPGPPPGVPIPRESSPVSYDEALSGDLPDTGPLTSVGTLAAGQNMVSGTASAISDAIGSVYDLDAFTFDIPTGLAVTAISYEWILTPVEGPVGELYSASIDYGLSAPSGFTTLSLELFDNAGTSGGATPAFEALLPSGVGTYALTTTGDGLSGLGSSGESLGWTVDYTWTITVVAP